MARIFVYDGREHPDPDPEMSVDEVRKAMADFFGELGTATSKESKRGDDTIIEFTRRVGTKGVDCATLAQILKSVPEKRLQILEVAMERATDDGGIISGQFDHTDEWLWAVAEAENYIKETTTLQRDLERLCRRYTV